MHFTQILIAPVVTEKSANAHGQSKYTFRVHQNATKIDVANAVKMAYGVDVDSVNVMAVQKKFRLAGRGRTITKRPASRKAIVTLKEKQSIDFNKLKTTK